MIARSPNLRLATIILAAGKGSRMRSALPKVMHRLAGKPLIAHVAATTAALKPERAVVVIAPGMDDVRQAAAAIQPGTEAVFQKEQHGTGHAVREAEQALKGFEGIALILFGDTPMIQSETLRQMVSLLASRKEAALAVLGMRCADPAEYGRLITDGSGELFRIVEYRDASDEERRITLCNSGVMAVRTPLLFSLLAEVKNDNAKGEYYLTDIVAIARHKSLVCLYLEGEEQELAGINTRAQLAEAEAMVQRRLREKAMERGVTLVAPETVFLSEDTIFGQDSVVHPHVVFGPGVTVGNNVEIRSFSHIEGARIAHGAIIGPFARLRPGAQIGENAHIGNFVEIKQSTIAKAAKVNHLSYIGDADVGQAANIGAGTITCNYDGFAKHRTAIGAGAFIGSDTCLVAPVTIGDNAIVGAGSVVTQDVAADAMAIARAEQQTLPGKGKEFRAKRQAKK